MTDLLEERIAERIRLCHRERRAYELWLGWLSPANATLVGLGGVISLISRLSIVTKAALVSPEIAGWGAVAGAALTGFHNRMQCDPHQAECRKLANQFAELQTEYERLQLEGEILVRQKELMQLEHKLAAIRGGQGAKPAKWCIRKASREI